MPRAKPNIESKICAAALSLAAKHGWQNLTLEQIAKAAKIPPARMRKIFPDKSRVLTQILREIDRQAAAVGKADSRATPHDRLFEALMARFDILQKCRMGALAILDAARRDPSLARSILPAQWKSMENALVRTGLAPSQSLHKPLAALGLLGVYYRALCAWRQDRTPDMAKTMAALDQALRLASLVAEILFRTR
jgi:AcrR family transcriptional regulator